MVAVCVKINSRICKFCHYIDLDLIHPASVMHWASPQLLLSSSSAYMRDMYEYSE